jgi:hypothetical protein
MGDTLKRIIKKKDMTKLWIRVASGVWGGIEILFLFF